MCGLIPIIYRNMNYPSHIKATIHEISGNFHKEKLTIKYPYSLHTECSYGKRIFCKNIVDKFNHIKDAQKDNVPQL